MICDAQKHRRAFEAGAEAAVASVCPLTPRFLRRRVIRAAMNAWPTTHFLSAYGSDAAYRQITESRRFRDDVGSIWLLLFSALVQAIVQALIDYWFATKETAGYA